MNTETALTRKMVIARRRDAREAAGTCIDCPRPARPGRQTCRVCSDKRALAFRGTRETLIYRCTICGSGSHTKARCSLAADDETTGGGR